jgi:hypothetical protein
MYYVPVPRRELMAERASAKIVCATCGDKEVVPGTIKCSTHQIKQVTPEEIAFHRQQQEGATKHTEV